jgi:nitrogen fixation NifU-like protein
MTEAVKGMSLAEVEALFAEVHELLTGGAASAPNLGKVSVLAGVREYPTRIKCATLAWHTLRAAAQGEQVAVTTE